MPRGYPDFEGDKVGLYLKPEWAAKEGVDKNFYAVGADKAFGAGADGSYVVPAGKTLYITQYSYYNRAVLAADADNNQMCWGYLTDLIIADVVFGGNGGGGGILKKPWVIIAGATMKWYIKNTANHNCHIGLVINGYEV